MGFAVCMGAALQCTFGMTPSTLTVLPQSRVMGCSLPMASIMDNKPIVNILPFGMCSSMANPVVAAATAAKLGVFTPMPCIPVTVAPWAPGSPTCLVGGNPALNNSSKLMCAYGGVISINNPGQSTINIP